MELLTGKCLVDFKKYLSENTRQINIGMIQFDLMEYEVFKQLGLKAQYGVLEDFFDCKGIRINIVEAGLLEFNVRFYLYDGDLMKSPINQSNRPNARKEAINTANELYNENNK